MNRVVVMTVYNRLEYLGPVLETWKSVRVPDGWMFLFMVEPSPVQLEVNKLIYNVGLEQYAIHNNLRREGVLVNPWTGMEMAFHNLLADFAVLAEDDIMVSTDVLEYMDWCREEYRHDEKVLTVNAKTGRPDPAPVDGVVRDTAFNPLVWGTWHDRWEKVLSPTWDKAYTTGGGHNAGWDHNINLRVMPQNGYQAVFPMASRAEHIGRRGTHMVDDRDFEAAMAPTWRHHRPPVQYREMA